MDDPQDAGEAAGGEGLDVDQFIKDLTQSQGNLRAYLLAALGNYDDAADVLQKTNLVLWRSAHRYQPGTDFIAWAITLARFELQSFFRDRSRDRHVFSEELSGMMLQTAAKELPDLDDRQEALRHCLQGLSARSQEMLQLRYDTSSSITQIADRVGKTEDAIKSALLRVRKSLERCIELRLRSDVS
ncbi:RNA polymerase sigma factor [Posidoniimonas polymericola]|uniref:RNA polymerase sigma factor n=1 Tax=Posidoniimonas polymericola TaxID=2528002 RepID=A0A5C5YTK3_9BACT|nr:sigma-70 family RNA polymerase sigma factor [Posidoniimonas polymericola]TWT78334.1 RNA polymerase sigma factor [Posidoniimonas polymericola]